MAYDDALAGRIDAVFARRKSVERKFMFGCVGYMLRGHFCVGVWKESLIARVGPASYEESLARPHVGVFDITGRAMRGWVVVAPEGVVTDAGLKHWLDVAAQFVATLPLREAE